MYLVNYLSLQAAQTIFIAAGRYRTAQNLVGPRDGVNCTFTTPGLEKFVHNLPFLSIHVYYNGVRLTLLDDYTISESGGFGTGYDTVTMEVAPMVDDKLLSDYIITAL